MTDKYQVKETTINTRRRAEQLAERATSEGCSVLDLTGVEFISRSVADELVHQSQANGLELVGLTGDTKKMVDIVADSETAVP